VSGLQNIVQVLMVGLQAHSVFSLPVRACADERKVAHGNLIFALVGGKTLE